MSDSFTHDSPWPTSASGSDEPSSSRISFPSHAHEQGLSMSRSSLVPSTVSTFSPHASIQINTESALPHIPLGSSPPPQPRSRHNTGAQRRTMSMGANGPNGGLPLTSKSTVIPAKKKKNGAAFPRPEEVWREALKTAYGRDKAFKLIQYTMRLYLLFHARSAALFKTSRGGEVVRRLSIAVSHLSMTRKCLILFNWLTPLIHITQPPSNDIPYASSTSIATLGSPTLMHRFLHAPPPVLLDLFNSVSDDISTFSKLGLIGPKIGRRAGRMADWFWFASTLAGLVEVGAERAMVKGMVAELETRIYESEMQHGGDSEKLETDEEELEKLKGQYGSLALSRTKLIMDLIFVSYEVFKVKRAAEPVKTFTGLASACLSSYKMYNSHHKEIAKQNVL